jgi:CheY-like chemotaxis protein
MKKEVKILIAEDNDGHSSLICKNLRRVGIINPLIEFKDGQEVLDFLFENNKPLNGEETESYLLLLDLKMPRIDGVEVLRRIKADEELKKMSVIIITSTDDPSAVDKCHQLGCSNYITKPTDYEDFVETIKKVGFFLTIVEMPTIKHIPNIQKQRGPIEKNNGIR